ncbi:MAG TPA: hypothetical protein VIY99_06010 [Terracidiphilus sp.]
MPTQEYCVYNETQENLLTPRVTVIDTRSEPLKAVKVLIEGLGPNAQSGLWLNPLDRVPSVPSLSSYDLVYLDRHFCVVKGVALVADNEVPPFDGEAASALVLPIHTFSASHTHPGDKFLLCTADEMEHRALPAQHGPASPLASLAHLEPAPPVFLPAQQIQPFEILPQVFSPAAAGSSAKTGFLRSVVHLRIQISVSITSTALPAAVSNSPAALPASEPGLRPPPSLLRRCAQTMGPSVAAMPLHIDRAAQSIVKASASFAAGCARRAIFALGLSAQAVRPAVAPLRAFAAHSAASFAAKRALCKSRYLRWAEVFVYGSQRVSTRNALHRRSPRLEEEC